MPNHNDTRATDPPAAKLCSTKRGFTSAALFVAFLLCIPLQAVDRAKVLSEASRSYYAFDAQGIKDFQCVAVLAPEIMADSFKLSPKDPEIQFMSDLRFAVLVDKDHQQLVTPYRKSGRKIDHDFILAEAGRQTVHDFFYLWGSFILTSPFARFGMSTVTLEGAHSYHILSRVNDVAFELFMTDNYMITSMNVTSRESTSVWLPTFTRTDKGFLLTNLIVQGSSARGLRKIDIEYQNIRGLKLPSSVNIESQVSGQSFSLELIFSHYLINKSHKH